jgi:hypothetical protein
MSVKSVRVVATPTVRGRVLVISRTDWTNSEGLSFDVHDQATDLCLTPASLDEWPGEDELDELVEQLILDFDDGKLDPFYDDAESLNTPYSDDDADMITQHVGNCDLVDGAGRALTAGSGAPHPSVPTADGRCPS